MLRYREINNRIKKKNTTTHFDPSAPSPSSSSSYRPRVGTKQQRNVTTNKNATHTSGPLRRRNNNEVQVAIVPRQSRIARPGPVSAYSDRMRAEHLRATCRVYRLLRFEHSTCFSVALAIMAAAVVAAIYLDACV